MFHILDESTEKGEKIAEAIDNMEPKSPEERLEEMVEEALGIEDGGELEEAMEELEEVVEELTSHTVATRLSIFPYLSPCSVTKQ